MKHFKTYLISLIFILLSCVYVYCDTGYIVTVSNCEPGTTVSLTYNLNTFTGVSDSTGVATIEVSDLGDYEIDIPYRYYSELVYVRDSETFITAHDLPDGYVPYESIVLHDYHDAFLLPYTLTNNSIIDFSFYINTHFSRSGSTYYFLGFYPDIRADNFSSNYSGQVASLVYDGSRYDSCYFHIFDGNNSSLNVDINFKLSNTFTDPIYNHCIFDFSGSYNINGQTGSLYNFPSLSSPICFGGVYFKYDNQIHYFNSFYEPDYLDLFFTTFKATNNGLIECLLVPCSDGFYFGYYSVLENTFYTYDVTGYKTLTVPDYPERAEPLPLPPSDYGIFDNGTTQFLQLVTDFALSCFNTIIPGTKISFTNFFLSIIITFAIIGIIKFFLGSASIIVGGAESAFNRYESDRSERFKK